MRSEKEMMDLIISVAQKDQRIRAVYMNGSRTNPNVPKDIFQDYDIVYVVTETKSFINDEKWVDVFGQLLMIQEPDKNDKSLGRDMDFDARYAYLMLFKDGNRIDLTLQTKETMLQEYKKDKLTVPILDKDNILPEIPAPTDVDYFVKRPTEAEFNSQVNDFWWCLQNVGKGIWRDELPYAKWMFEYTSKKYLDNMISWWIGLNNDFNVSPGKLGKYYKKFLPIKYWDMYLKTYSDGDYDNMWESIFITCELYRALALEVAENFGFQYPMQDDINMTEYLRQVRTLPKDAVEIF